MSDEYRPAPPRMHNPADGPITTPDGTPHHRYGLNRRGELVINPYYRPRPAPATPTPRSNPIAEHEMASAGLPSITNPPEQPKQPDPATAPTVKTAEEQEAYIRRLLGNT